MSSVLSLTYNKGFSFQTEQLLERLCGSVQHNAPYPSLALSFYNPYFASMKILHLRNRAGLKLFVETSTGIIDHVSLVDLTCHHFTAILNRSLASSSKLVIRHLSVPTGHNVSDSNGIPEQSRGWPIDNFTAEADTTK